jgi:WD40 repeat protein
MPIQINRLHSITGHNDCIYTLEGSSENSRFFSASGDGMVVSWDLSTPENGELIAKLPHSVYALHFHPLSGLLIAGHNYEGIHLLDWKNKKETASLKLTVAAVFDIKSFENYLFVATGDGMILKVDQGSMMIKNKVQASQKSARCMDVNESRGEIAVGFSDNFIRIFDFDLNLKYAWQGHENSVFTVRYSPDGNGLLSGSRDARLKLWDITDSYSKTTEVVAHMYAINHLDFSPDKKHFVTCSLDKSIKVWDTKELKLLKVIDRTRHGGHRTSVNKVLWTAYHDQLLSASDDRTISVWHMIF